MMNYGNYAPYYRSSYFNQNLPDVQYPSQNTSDLLWVLNESEAASYPVAMNNTVVLWDKSLPIIYVKSVDGRGVPSMRVLEFKERTSQSQQEHKCQCGDKYASKEQYDELRASYEALNSKYQSLIEKIDSMKGN